MGCTLCGVCRIVMGEEGSPHGVRTLRIATAVKPEAVREEMPVPPITAIRTGWRYVPGREEVGSDIEGNINVVRESRRKKKKKKKVKIKCVFMCPHKAKGGGWAG